MTRSSPLRRIRTGCVLCMLHVAAIGCGSSTAAPQPVASNGERAGSGDNGEAAVEKAQSASPEDCAMQSTELFEDRSQVYGRACADCICAQSAYAVSLCNEQAENCWGLIECVGANCAGKEGAEASDCAVTLCGQFIEGAGIAMAVGALLQGDACSGECTTDGGAGAGGSGASE